MRWLVAAALLAGISEARADGPRRAALLVGVNRYTAPVLADKPLRFAERDAVELGRVLKAQGFDEVKVLTGPAATRKAIDAALDQLLANPKADDLVLVAFAGHGAQMGLRDGDGQTVADEQGRALSEAYFCPVDAVLGRPQTMVSLTLLMSRLRNEAGVTLMLVDACRDDPAEAAARGFRSLSGDELVGRLPKDSAVVFSCSAGQRAMETDRAGGGHGVFFHHVIEGLQGKAADPETGEVTWDDLVSYLRKNVNRKAREWDPEGAKLADARSRGQLQNPHALGNLVATPLLAKVDLSRRPTVPPAANPPAANPPASSPPASKPDRPTTPSGAAPEVITSRSTGMRLRIIPSGEFLMGSPNSDDDAWDNEKPQKKVTISRNFYIGETEATQKEYQAVLSGISSIEFSQRENAPVTSVRWLDAVTYCNSLSVKDGRTPIYRISGKDVSVPDWSADGYRLPTEAEWERACRARGTANYGFADDPAQLGEYAWFRNNSVEATRDVRQKRANMFGLFDIQGNAGEWCWDGYEKTISGGVDPRGPSGALHRVIRGGNCRSVPGDCRPARRDWLSPDSRLQDLGFRVAAVQAGR